MKGNRSSRTAALVAGARGLAGFLPEHSRVAQDSYGLRFAGPAVKALVRMPSLCRGLLRLDTPLRRGVMWIQVRTRTFDDVMLEFVRAGGEQIIMLGAGFDSRSLRFASELRAAHVFEVDHPATQARKLRLLARAGLVASNVQYVAWNFETEPLSHLAAVLAERGHVASKPSLVLWEGVTMYLSPAAIEASVACVAALCAAGSTFAFNYVDRGFLGRDFWAKYAAGSGEPQDFGWEPAELAGWLASRGFRLLSQRCDAELAAHYLPRSEGSRMAALGRRVAIAVRTTDAAAAPV